MEIRKILDVTKAENFIFNLGHGMWPNHDIKKVEVLVNEVHEYSKKLLNWFL